ncbi:hypothetical protein HDU82_006435 [Entophlyctis luteolus]|nr:hypothetical protein HDU82_006435 [Entophlyctis luteolus]
MPFADGEFYVLNDNTYCKEHYTAAKRASTASIPPVHSNIQHSHPPPLMEFGANRPPIPPQQFQRQNSGSRQPRGQSAAARRESMMESPDHSPSSSLPRRPRPSRQSSVDASYSPPTANGTLQHTRNARLSMPSNQNAPFRHPLQVDSKADYTKRYSQTTDSGTSRSAELISPSGNGVMPRRSQSVNAAVTASVSDTHTVGASINKTSSTKEGATGIRRNAPTYTSAQASIKAQQIALSQRSPSHQFAEKYPAIMATSPFDPTSLANTPRRAGSGSSSNGRRTRNDIEYELPAALGERWQ